MNLLEIRVRAKDGTEAIHPIDNSPFVVGRGEDTNLCLDDKEISRKHLAIYLEDDGVWVEDQSANGTLMAGARIPGGRKVPWQESSPIAIGPFLLEQVIQKAAKAKVDASLNEKPSAEGLNFNETKLFIHKELLKNLDLRWKDYTKKTADELKREVSAKIGQLILEVQDFSESIDTAEFIRQLTNDVIGLGPLEDLLEDDSISEIMVVAPDQVFVERSGKIELTDISFASPESLMAVIERIVAPIGKRIDESSPMVDARLSDGSRVNAVIPPVALKGPCLTIRKFSKDPFGINDLIHFGSMTKEMAEFLRCVVMGKRNIIISGGTGSGKTTLLNVLSGFIPPTERIVTIEDSAELQLPQKHVIIMESKPPNIEGKGEISIRDLVKNALRMRPDRIVVGECRGGEALDMLQAMNTGHNGSLTTIHANSPYEAISRLETLALQSDTNLPDHAIRGQIATAINLIVQQNRFPDGSRKITHITEVLGFDDEKNITAEDIFTFEQRGYDREGRVKGALLPTGYVPVFMKELVQMGIPIQEEMFKV